MTQNMQAVQSGPISPPSPIVNDFAMTFCTVNGSGSATANLTVMRAIFKMGIPVSGKNIFPSNIQGLPTWYTIRINKDGFTARVEKDDIIIAMNPATFIHDLDYIVPGGVVFYSDEIKTPPTRDDLFYYPMPVKKLVRNNDAPPQLREFIMNMVYVGVVAQVLGIELGAVRQALEYHFKGKKTPVESNFGVIKGAFDWAAENIVKKDPYFVAPMEATKGEILSDGNTAAALGAIFGGVQFVSWYPITPASSLPEALNEYLPVFRTKKDTGEQTFAIVQAEDEIAAAGMLVGAGWAGLRAMTATSGPGLSLMTENIGLAYFAEVPLVIWDVQRIGPSTGMPTRTAQGDITEVYFMSHGDTNIIQLFPSSVNECFDFGWQAFDIAERFQTPVVVMSDLDLGMNQWMSKPFEYPDRPMDRGKILWEKDLEKFINEDHKHWGRYLDLDGDGIPYRTVPGNQNPKSAYFTRGTGHDEYAFYSEEPDVWERLMARLGKKYQSARQYVPTPVISRMDGARFGIIAFGSTDPAVAETRAQLLQEGIATDYLRIRALPASEEVAEFIRSHDRVYIVEINRDGQMRQILTLNFPELAPKMRKVARSNGMPLSARWIKETILGYETPMVQEKG
jgi:2-oxoglutarate/2-oxoacid ferredoxin oxidoreductase subunit alpha